MEERKEGYYWVKGQMGGWFCCRFTDEGWKVGGFCADDSHFLLINENRIPDPDEVLDIFEQEYYGYDKIEEAIFKRLRSVADHNEIGIEFKSDVNGKYFDIDSDLLDRV